MGEEQDERDKQSKTVRGQTERVNYRREVREEFEEINPQRDSRLGDGPAEREREKKEPCDKITAMDMNMKMNCVARFKSNPVVLSLMFTTQSQQGLEATLALSIISLSLSLSLSL